MLDPVPPPDSALVFREARRSPSSRPWSSVPLAALLGLVVAASALAGLLAIGLLDRDDGGTQDAVAVGGGQQVVAGPAEGSPPGAASPVGEREQLVVGAAETDGEAAMVASAEAGATGKPAMTGVEWTGTSTGTGATEPTTPTDPSPSSTDTSTTGPGGTGTSTPARAGRTGTTTTATSGRSTTTTRATTTQPTTTTRPTTTGGSGTVIWQDDFDRFDASTWRREHSTYGDGNNELQCYQPGNVSVSGGRLILQARTETVTCPNGSTRRVSSGMVRSQGVTFSPGQAIEFRVKLNPADPDDQGGLWPAVWASGWAGGGWPAGGELDWLEVMTAEDPTRAMFSMHYAGPDGANRLQNRGVRGGSDFSAAWHTVRFDYGHDGRLRWSLDGAPAFAVDAAATLQGYPAPFDQTIGEIKINLALGGRPGPLAAGAVGSTGATFEVDYIRIIQL